MSGVPVRLFAQDPSESSVPSTARVTGRDGTVRISYLHGGSADGHVETLMSMHFDDHIIDVDVADDLEEGNDLDFDFNVDYDFDVNSNGKIDSGESFSLKEVDCVDVDNDGVDDDGKASVDVGFTGTAIVSPPTEKATSVATVTCGWETVYWVSDASGDSDDEDIGEGSGKGKVLTIDTDRNAVIVNLERRDKDDNTVKVYSPTQPVRAIYDSNDQFRVSNGDDSKAISIDEFEDEITKALAMPSAGEVRWSSYEAHDRSDVAVFVYFPPDV